MVLKFSREEKKNDFPGKWEERERERERTEKSRCGSRNGRIKKIKFTY